MDLLGGDRGGDLGAGDLHHGRLGGDGDRLRERGALGHRDFQRGADGELKLRRCQGANPSAARSSWYSPTASTGKRNRPWRSVAAVCAWLRSRSVIVTRAPATGAPPASWTVPRTLAEVGAC